MLQKVDRSSSATHPETSRGPSASSPSQRWPPRPTICSAHQSSHQSTSIRSKSRWTWWRSQAVTRRRVMFVGRSRTWSLVWQEKQIMHWSWSGRTLPQGSLRKRERWERTTWSSTSASRVLTRCLNLFQWNSRRTSLGSSPTRQLKTSLPISRVIKLKT